MRRFLSFLIYIGSMEESFYLHHSTQAQFHRAIILLLVFCVTRSLAAVEYVENRLLGEGFEYCKQQELDELSNSDETTVTSCINEKDLEVFRLNESKGSFASSAGSCSYQHICTDGVKNSLIVKFNEEYSAVYSSQKGLSVLPMTGFLDDFQQCCFIGHWGECLNKNADVYYEFKMPDTMTKIKGHTMEILLSSKTEEQKTAENIGNIELSKDVSSDNIFLAELNKVTQPTFNKSVTSASLRFACSLQKKNELFNLDISFKPDYLFSKLPDNKRIELSLLKLMKKHLYFKDYKLFVSRDDSGHNASLVFEFEPKNEEGLDNSNQVSLLLREQKCERFLGEPIVIPNHGKKIVILCENSKPNKEITLTVKGQSPILLSVLTTFISSFTSQFADMYAMGSAGISFNYLNILLYVVAYSNPYLLLGLKIKGVNQLCASLIPAYSLFVKKTYQRSRYAVSNILSKVTNVAIKGASNSKLPNFLFCWLGFCSVSQAQNVWKTSEGVSSEKGFNPPLAESESKIDIVAHKEESIRESLEGEGSAFNKLELGSGDFYLEEGSGKSLAATSLSASKVLESIDQEASSTSENISQEMQNRDSTSDLLGGYGENNEIEGFGQHSDDDGSGDFLFNEGSGDSVTSPDLETEITNIDGESSAAASLSNPISGARTQSSLSLTPHISESNVNMVSPADADGLSISPSNTVYKDSLTSTQDVFKTQQYGSGSVMSTAETGVMPVASMPGSSDSLNISDPLSTSITSLPISSASAMSPSIDPTSTMTINPTIPSASESIQVQSTSLLLTEGVTPAPESISYAPAIIISGGVVLGILMVLPVASCIYKQYCWKTHNNTQQARSTNSTKNKTVKVNL